MQKIDGYTSNQDWLIKHKELIPSSFLFSVNYEDITEMQIPTKDPNYYEYTPRPSFKQLLPTKVKLKDIISIVNLDERELKIVKYIYEQNLTQTEVGCLLDISQGLVSIIHAKILKKFKLKLVN